MKKYQEFLMEAKMASKQECADRFGKILFGSAFNLKEPDTTFEVGVWSSIHSFIRYNEIDPKIVKSLTSLYECSKSFQKELATKKKHLYRGTYINKKQFEKLDWSIETPKWYGAHFTYKSRRKIQSWSSNQGIALNFAMGEDNGAGEEGVKLSEREYINLYDAYIDNILSNDQLPMLVEINPSKSDPYLFSEAFSNKLANRIIGYGEYEIIRLTGKPVHGVYWIPKKVFDEIEEQA